MSGCDGEELRRKLHQGDTSCRQERELHDCMFRHGLALEELMNETEAENKCLTSKMKELQQQVENMRKRREEEDEEALRQELLFEEERIVKSQYILIRKMEKENQKLREKSEDLTAQLEQLSLGEKYQEEIQNLRRAEQALKHTLEEIQEVLRPKDEEIEMKSVTLIKKNYEIKEYYNTIEDLRQHQQELREQLGSRQEEQTLAALNFKEESTTRETGQTPGSAATDEEDEDKDERLLKTENWWSCAKGLWKGVKVAGAIALHVLLPVGIMASMVLTCYSPNPDHNLWNMAFDLLEPYCELHHTVPPVY